MLHPKSLPFLPTFAFSTLAFAFVACAGSSANSDEAAGGSKNSGGNGGSGGASNATGGSASGGSSAGGKGGNAAQGGNSAGNGGGTESNGGATTASGGTGGMAGAASGGSAGMTVGGAGGFGLGGPSRCATSGALFCEDFENGLDAAKWTTTKSGDATAVVDETHAARGKKALHVRTAAGAGFAYIQEKKTFPIKDNMVFGRMYVWFDDAITTDGHFSLAEGSGTGTKALIRFGGQNQAFGVGTDLGPSGDWTDKDNTLIPNKKWLCMEFQFKSDTNEFRVWWDDKELTTLRSGPSKHANFTMPQFTSLWFGWWMYNKQEPQDLWIDDIAVNNQPIGCVK